MKKKIVASIVILLITFTIFYTNIVWAKTWQDYKNLSDNEWSTFFSQCYDKVINKQQKLTLEEEEKLALAMQNGKGNLTAQQVTSANDALKNQPQNSNTSQATTTTQGEGTSITTEKTPPKQHTLTEIIQEGQDFIAAGEKAGEKISQTDLQKLSNTIYNVLLVLGIVIAVILGGILGIKFVTEGVEGQADVKKALVPYILGCIVVFGSFAIWKIVVNVLQSV